MTINNRIVLASRPEGAPTPENFRLEQAPVAAPGEGEVLVRTAFLSLDPYMRGRMSTAKSYAAPIGIGEVMGGEVVGHVVESRDPHFKPGDAVRAYSGWQEYAVLPGRTLAPVDESIAPLSTYLGVLGMPGFTAWAGLRHIGKPKKGETLAVAAATGPVGSVVGQLARLAGARAVGIAGGPEKTAFLRELGFDAAVDHRAPDFRDALKAACPDGIDVYFENVGGAVFAAVLPLLNQYARLPICGLIAEYNATGQPLDGPDRLPLFMRTVLVKSLTVRGFIQLEFAGERGEFEREMAAHLREGRIRYREDVTAGLEHAPAAFIGLLEGRNFGKALVRVA